MQEHRPLTFICVLFSLFFNTSIAAPVSHPDFQPTRGDVELKSTATATWLAFIDVYDAALYASSSAQANRLLVDKSPFSLEIRYEAADVALGRQHTEEQRAKYQSDVDALHTFYQDVVEGDRFRLDINPNNGLSLFFNDGLVYQNANLNFARYYVGLWLAEEPLSDAVRLGLLDW